MLLIKMNYFKGSSRKKTLSIKFKFIFEIPAQKFVYKKSQKKITKI